MRRFHGPIYKPELNFESITQISVNNSILMAMTTSFACFGNYKECRDSRLFSITLNSATMEKLLSKLHKKPRRTGYVPLQNNLGTVWAPASGYSGGRRTLAFLADTLG